MHASKVRDGIMRKLSGVLICLYAAAFIHCAEEPAPVDPASFITLTSGFASSYISFQITAGVTAAPEYLVLNMVSGLSQNGSNYEAAFYGNTSNGTHNVSVVLPSPGAGSSYLESSAGLIFSYTRGTTEYIIYSGYSIGNDFRVDITEWSGTGGYMKATFSGYVCNGSGTTDCLTVENGLINALIH